MTSAYNPRTNGLVERFNGVFMKCLRKHAENNPLDWPKWMTFILMSYRTKVNSSTGFSPFRLVFGREMNQLKDWTSSQVGDEAASILARVKQLKQHSEQVVTKAVKNINDSQIRQRQQQNKSIKVDESLIRVGSRVYVKIRARRQATSSLQRPFHSL